MGHGGRSILREPWPLAFSPWRLSAGYPGLDGQAQLRGHPLLQRSRTASHPQYSPGNAVRSGGSPFPVPLWGILVGIDGSFAARNADFQLSSNSKRCFHTSSFKVQLKGCIVYAKHFFSPSLSLAIGSSSFVQSIRAAACSAVQDGKLRSRETTMKPTPYHRSPRAVIVIVSSIKSHSHYNSLPSELYFVFSLMEAQECRTLRVMVGLWLGFPRQARNRAKVEAKEEESVLTSVALRKDVSIRN